MGDKIDNIPGVDGIGEKRAIALAKQGDLEHLFENAATLSPKVVREALSKPEVPNTAHKCCFHSSLITAPISTLTLLTFSL